MKRRILLLATGVLLFVSAWAVYENWPASKGPMYQGKSARAWLREASTTNQMKAFAAFHEMGTNAAPFLVRELERKDSAWDQFYRWIYPRMPMNAQKHFSPPLPELVRWNSAEMMIVNVDARAEMTKLIRLLKEGNNEQQFCAIRAVVNFIRPGDTQYVPVLIDKLQSTNLVLRPLAAIALGRVGPGARAAVPALTNLLDSLPTENLRQQALGALQRIDARAAGKYEISWQKQTAPTNSQAEVKEK